MTGTARQYVADDYTARHVKSLNDNFAAYEKLINRLANKSAGVFAHFWSPCMVSNGTYLDCPVSYQVNRTFVTAVQNPSMQAVYYQKIKLPHKGYSVKAWNPTQKQWVVANSIVICHDHTFENGYTIRDCDMWIDNKVDAKSFAWLQVYYDPMRPDPTPGFKMFEYLTENTRGSLFKVYDGAIERYMAFQLRYYQADEGGDNYPNTDNVASGAYIFKPAKGKQYSMPYSSLVWAESASSQWMQ